MKTNFKTKQKGTMTSKNSKGTNTGCGFVTFTPNIATTPSGNYRVKVGGTTITCSSKALAYKTRKRLLAARNA